MYAHRTGLSLGFMLLLSGACTAAKPVERSPTAPAKPMESPPPSEPVGADFLSISRPGSSYQARWSEVRVSRDSGGFRTDIFAKAAPAGEGEELVEVHFVLIQLHGPGEYPLGFGWDRGKSRVTIQSREGMRCMTPASDAGSVEITAAPKSKAWAPGERLEGRYRVHCFPEAKATPGQEARVFTGAFSVTVGGGP
jgi:hypothetical protein